VEKTSPYEERKFLRECAFCGGNLIYQFPLDAVKGIQFFEPYYDEALDCDILGRQHKQQVLKSMGLQEAGDSVGGARNFDAKAPYHVKPLPLRGKSPVTPEMRQAAIERETKEDWDVAVEKAPGKFKPIDFGNAKDL
jgi:hypothetical protein